MPRCRICSKKKREDQFYPRQIRANGKVGECKQCTRERVRNNRRKKAGYYREYDRKRFQNDAKVRARHLRYQATDAGKESMAKSREKWLAENPEKRAAHIMVGNAIKSGKLIKSKTCQTCGSEPSRVEGHHSDYNRPLDVMWLCRPCHVAEHNHFAKE